MSGSDPSMGSAGAYLHWQAVQQVFDASVPKQFGSSCGQHVVQMMLVDRGIHTKIEAIIGVIGHDGETTHDQLILALETLDPSVKWEARLEPEDDDTVRTFSLYFQGWWAAMIKEYERPAHWVLVRGCGDDGLLEVRDTADATRSWISWSEFDKYWTHILVRET